MPLPDALVIQGWRRVQRITRLRDGNLTGQAAMQGLLPALQVFAAARQNHRGQARLRYVHYPLPRAEPRLFVREPRLRRTRRRQQDASENVTSEQSVFHTVAEYKERKFRIWRVTMC